MDFFEYLMVMVSIVIGLGMAQLLRGLGKIARGAQRYWVQTTWAVSILFLHLQVWWGLWDLRDATAWNLFGFIVLVSVPVTLFAAAELIVPHDSRVATDWRQHFYDVRLWFFSAFLAFLVVAALATWILEQVPLIHPYRLAQAVEVVLGLIGLLSASPRVHAFLAPAYLTFLLFNQVLFRFLPGLG